MQLTIVILLATFGAILLCSRKAPPPPVYPNAQPPPPWANNNNGWPAYNHQPYYYYYGQWQPVPPQPDTGWGLFSPFRWLMSVLSCGCCCLSSCGVMFMLTLVVSMLAGNAPTTADGKYEFL